MRVNGDHYYLINIGTNTFINELFLCVAYFSPAIKKITLLCIFIFTRLKIIIIIKRVR